MILTSLRRDSLDRYGIECVFCRTASTYAQDLARQHGFTYEPMTPAGKELIRARSASE